jgi:hypothetical protein
VRQDVEGPCVAVQFPVERYRHRPNALEKPLLERSALLLPEHRRHDHGKHKHREDGAQHEHNEMRAVVSSLSQPLLIPGDESGQAAAVHIERGKRTLDLRSKRAGTALRHVQ